MHARNKKAVTLNLREDAGRELFLDLVERSDIIVENFRPGTLEKWNLGYDVLRERNQGIILVRVSGYGQTGPEAHKAGYASVAEAASGLRHMNGFPGGPPRDSPCRSATAWPGCSPPRAHWPRCIDARSPARDRSSTLLSPNPVWPYRNPPFRTTTWAA